MATIRQMKYATIARSHGIRNSLIAIEEGAKLGVGPALAVAMLEQESGGRNVWGHDPTIFVGGWDGKHHRWWTRDRWKGYVNEKGYKEYKRQRIASLNRKMQGVGPMQLTWWATQDAADKIGGCWRPRSNIITGFTTLSALIRAHGMRDGIRRYNGSGPRAEAYAQAVLEKRAKWRKRFGIR